jgi:hypothetical protein
MIEKKKTIIYDYDSILNVENYIFVTCEKG